MPTPRSQPQLTQKQILKFATSQSYQRGEKYYQNGAICHPTRQGQRLWADCHGTDLYQPSVTLDQSGILTSSCTCPYDRGGICKHQVALLLTYINEPESFYVIPPLTDLLKSRNREDLVNLIEQMLQKHPDLFALIELSVPQTPGQPLPLATYQRQAQQAFSRQSMKTVASALAPLSQAAQTLLQSDDWSNAGNLYNMLLQESIDRYDWRIREIDYDGDIAIQINDFADGLADCMTHAITLDEPTRQTWLNTFLAAVFKDIEMGGIDFAYSAHDALLEYATDEEWQAIAAQIRQEIDRVSKKSNSQWEQEALVRLLTQRLEQHGQSDAAHTLIYELGSPQQQVFLLVKQGKFPEAVTLAQPNFTALPGLVLQLGNALIEAGASELALQYIMEEHQKQSQKKHRGYEDWLMNYHDRYGTLETTLEWQQKIFLRSPSLEAYQKLKQLAQKIGTWNAIQPQMIQQLESQNQIGQLIEIALLEHEIDRALQWLPQIRGGIVNHYTQEVAKAAELTHPKTAINLYQALTTELIGRKNRSAYQEAIPYLQRVKSLYESLNQPQDWQTYIQQIRAEYPTLKALQNELQRANLSP